MSVEGIWTVTEVALTGKQLVILCDASKHAAAYELLIEDYTDEETRETSKFPSVAFGSKPFTTGQISFVVYPIFSNAPSLWRVWTQLVGNQKTYQSNDQ